MFQCNCERPQVTQFNMGGWGFKSRFFCSLPLISQAVKMAPVVLDWPTPPFTLWLRSSFISHSTPWVVPCVSTGNKHTLQDGHLSPDRPEGTWLPGKLPGCCPKVGCSLGSRRRPHQSLSLGACLLKIVLRFPYTSAPPTPTPSPSLTPPPQDSV